MTVDRDNRLAGRRIALERRLAAARVGTPEHAALVAAIAALRRPIARAAIVGALLRAS